MRALVQRVTSGKVTMEGKTVAKIGHGMVILLGIGHGDTEEQARFLAEKIATLRIFEDPAGKFNLSLLDVSGAAIVVSQFTLYGDARKGAVLPFRRRPGPKKPRRLWKNSLNSCASRASRHRPASSVLICWSRSKMMAR